jgi:hypothetical protein
LRAQISDARKELCCTHRKLLTPTTGDATRMGVISRVIIAAAMLQHQFFKLQPSDSSASNSPAKKDAARASDFA